VRKTMLPFTVNSLAQVAAIASLAAEDELMERVDLVVKERDRVRSDLIAQGWTVPPTEANFVWLPLGERSAAFAEACDQAGVSIRPYPPDGVRVTVADPEANDAFLAAARACSYR
jgi:histidinol-phosphate aminotransferase